MEKLNIGKENATFQQILTLKNNRKKRAQMGLFFIEGVNNIKEAILNNWEIDAFIFSRETNLSGWAKSVLDYANKNYILSSELMKMLSDKVDTSELLALIKMKHNSEIKKPKNPVFVLLYRPSKKGNLGTIIRSCDAMQVDQMFFSGHSVDVYDHEVITASMGSFFKLPITFVSSNNHFSELIKELKVTYPELQVVATSLQTSDSVQECDFTKPTMLLVGNETDGLCMFYNDVADKKVKIKMREGIDSLNIACATTVCLYEIQRQRT